MSGVQGRWRKTDKAVLDHGLDSMRAMRRHWPSAKKMSTSEAIAIVISAAEANAGGNEHCEKIHRAIAIVLALLGVKK